MQRHTEPKPLIFYRCHSYTLIFYKCHSYTFICIDTQNQTHCILQVSFIHIHIWRCTQAKPLLFYTCHSYKFICRGHRAESLIFYKCHSYTFICVNTQNQSHWYFISIIHTHLYAEIHRTKAIDILHVSFKCSDIKRQSHWYFTSIIHTYSYADIHRIKAIDILQVSFIHIHMRRYTEPKPLILYKYHSYTFICRYTQNQSHWYFTSVIHTHSYADIHIIKAIDILQVSSIHIHMQIYTESQPLIFYKCHSYTFICNYIQNHSHWYFTSVIHTHSYADIHRIKAIDILQVSFIHIHMQIYTDSKPLIFYKCHPYAFICRYTQNQSHWYFTSVIHTHSYADIHKIKAIDILQVSSIHIHQTIQELLCIFKVCYTRY